MLFTKLLWCNKAKVLIGYVPNDDIIWLMNSFCMLYQIVRNEFRINAIFYEPLTNEAVVTGPNKVTVKKKNIFKKKINFFLYLNRQILVIL